MSKTEPSWIGKANPLDESEPEHVNCDSCDYPLYSEETWEIGGRSLCADCAACDIEQLGEIKAHIEIDCIKITRVEK
jgi:hypothetical protein